MLSVSFYSREQYYPFRSGLRIYSKMIKKKHPTFVWSLNNRSRQRKTKVEIIETVHSKLLFPQKKLVSYSYIFFFQWARNTHDTCPMNKTKKKNCFVSHTHMLQFSSSNQMLHNSQFSWFENWKIYRLVCICIKLNGVPYYQSMALFSLSHFVFNFNKWKFTNDFNVIRLHSAFCYIIIIVVVAFFFIYEYWMATSGIRQMHQPSGLLIQPQSR